MAAPCAESIVEPRAARTLLAGGAASIQRHLTDALADLGAIIDGRSPEVVVCIQDPEEPSGDVLARLSALRCRFPAAALMFVAVRGSETLAVGVFRAGATDYVSWPVAGEVLAQTWQRIVPAAQPVGLPPLIGDSPAMCEVRDTLRRIGPTPCNVLVCGETGTGKEVVARLLHASSRRAGKPFVTINCSAVPEGLFESELFGYERGAFTGAFAASGGRLQAAQGGTVFLDEIGELTLSAQPKLLRAIEQREVQRLGGRGVEAIDVRWVAATNRDLAAVARDGRFRADLFYRLNVCCVTLPPLSARRGDIPLLAQAFLDELAHPYGRPGARFSPDALARLSAYAWPGNVRELRNAVESSLARAQSADIDVDELPPAICGPFATARPEVYERMCLVEALRAAGGNKSAAAQRLHWSRMTLYRKIARYRLDVTSARDTVTRNPSHE